MQAFLKYKCPSCGKAFAPIHLSRSATQVVRRTCQRCRELWQIKVTPREVCNGDVVISVGELTFLGRRPAKARAGRRGACVLL